ncbi:GGDEF domain-containing protein [Maricaulis sp. CAU 1757]
MRIGPFNAAGRTGKTATARSGRTTGSPTGASHASAPRDAASIMGIPEAELTPNVQQALLSLMGEVDQLRQETERLRGRIRELESLADHDVLLPVLNRRAFVREVSKSLALAERHQTPSALLYLDLNGFKAINDTHGHAAGDAALHHVVSILGANVRETDSIGRLGGDEFGVLLTLTEMPGAEAKARELVRLVETTPFRHNGEVLEIGAAWGLQALKPGGQAEEAMAMADAAMYERKRAQKAADPVSSKARRA